jgi:SAM-dependent methyltransferase
MEELESTPKRSMHITLTTQHPVAWESPDFVAPWGTKSDSSRNHRFNTKLYNLFSYSREPLRILDLGCSGGGFVRDCVNDGCLAVGLEGSDYSQKMKRAEWATIPHLLFTCDITKPFRLLLDDLPLTFDAITAWEVLEHIHSNDLPGLVENVKLHLRPGGFWVASVSPNNDFIDGINLHQTVKPFEWWVNRMHELGLQHNSSYLDYFNTQYVRGPKFGAPGSFHLVLSAQTLSTPPTLTTRVRILDSWHGSRAQRIFRRLIVGEY